MQNLPTGAGGGERTRTVGLYIAGISDRPLVRPRYLREHPARLPFRQTDSDHCSPQSTTRSRTDRARNCDCDGVSSNRDVGRVRQARRRPCKRGSLTCELIVDLAPTLTMHDCLGNSQEISGLGPCCNHRGCNGDQVCNYQYPGHQEADKPSRHNGDWYGAKVISRTHATLSGRPRSPMEHRSRRQLMPWSWPAMPPSTQLARSQIPVPSTVPPLAGAARR